MLITAHGLVGAFVGREVGYPPLAFLLGLVSHFLLDAIPHCDGPDDVLGRNENASNSVAQYIIVIVDILFAVAILFYFINNNLSTTGLIWGVVGAELPDIVDNMPFWSRRIRRVLLFKQFHNFHAKIQSIKTPLWIGLTTQYLIAAIFLWLIFQI